MESQINSLETRTEKMEEKFNKDLEEIKESQYIMNNTINKIKNTLEATNSRITEAEDRIQEMQERFNKDLEEIKESQYIMNNAINEIKNTLAGTNSRIIEAEDRISEVEDRMVEINETERKKELKEMRTTSETSGTMLNAPTFES